MFDRDLSIIQTGNTVARVIPKVTDPECRITTILDPVSKETAAERICVLALYGARASRVVGERRIYCVSPAVALNIQ